MLETKDLCKTYKPKKGVQVNAVDHVSLRFPETGMVFLLGKSGSGKSTMLNLLGGLDSYDGGEIIIKGISSKDFTQQRFDSYRNTYVGFIFQEYNVLEEFTVGANIALAIELQGKTATDEQINAILRDVDLDGYGSRKPNELSGGQKQRVAIARALVKNPEIIMADEPTGALDSNTGRQVLDTLKKLSQQKLVIIVSHDREYAEQYADRIIELADGKVIRDVEAIAAEEAAEEKQLIFRPTSIEIPADYHLTEEDRIRINEYLDQLRAGASLMLPSQVQRFKETDESRIPVQDGSKFNLIKSRLPMKSAFKIGASSLKHKRFRLVMTILLSVVAFTLFSLVDTFSSYDHIRACTDSLIDSGVNYASVNKSLKHGNGIDSWWSSYGMMLSEADMAKFKEETGIDVTGIFVPRSANLRIPSHQYDNSYEFGKGDYQIYLSGFKGFAEITEESLKLQGYTFEGKIPDGSKKEIAISAAMANTFVQAGYHEPIDETDSDITFTSTKPDTITKKEDEKLKYETIAAPKNMIGKTLRINETDYTVTAIVDTQFDLSRYDRLKEPTEQLSTADRLLNYALFSEFSTAVHYSLTGAAMVGKGAVAKMVEAEPKVFDIASGYLSITTYNGNEDKEINADCYANNVTSLSKIPDSEIIWLDGKKEKLADDEFILSLDAISIWGNDSVYTEYQKLLESFMESGEEPTVKQLNDFVEVFLNSNKNLRLNYHYTDPETGEQINSYDNQDSKQVKIVGFTKIHGNYFDGTMVIPDWLTDKLISDIDGIYDTAVGGMPTDRAEVEKFVRYCYQDGDDVRIRYELNNAVTYELDAINDVLKVLAKVFLWIGVFFAVFAALLMTNFITTSIHYKRQEIGILRAIGSRSSDVFRIFFSESFLIAMINLVISGAFCCTIVTVANWAIRKYLGILVTVLHFGIRQVALLMLVSVGVAAIASFIPVKRIASKKPIDAIRDR